MTKVKPFLITGSRDYARLPLVDSFLFGFINNPGNVEVGTLFIGDARGVDRAARDAYLKYSGKLPRIFRANWDKFGNGAGPIRNKEMVDALIEAGGCMVFAFWDGKSHGTKHCMEYAKSKGFGVYIVEGYKTIDWSTKTGDLILKMFEPEGK